jgi:pantoate--beta-alanine ligase
MILLKTTIEMSIFVAEMHRNDTIIGFVPTMGALHKGHISLIESSKQKAQVTICSIFVNPTQFNNASDFEKYPITIEKDIELLKTAGCDVLFLPTSKQIYPDGIDVTTTFELGFLDTILEGQYRSGHFNGVCMVVKRLLQIVQPNFLLLGQKDYQQCMVIKKLITITNIKTQVIICPTLREQNELAMSSRNMRLTEIEKQHAANLFLTLNNIKNKLQAGDVTNLTKQAKTYLSEKGFKVDYVEIADANNLTIINNWDGKTKLVALVAAYINEVRLIDNMLLN